MLLKGENANQFYVEAVTAQRYLPLKLIKHKRISESPADMYDSESQVTKRTNKTASSSAFSFATRISVLKYWQSALRLFRPHHHDSTTLLCILLVFARNSGEGEMKLKGKTRLDVRREITVDTDLNLCLPVSVPGAWSAFLSEPPSLLSALWTNAEFSTVGVEFSWASQMNSLVFNCQELMNFWMVVSSSNSHIFEWQHCSQLSHAPAFLSIWDQNHPPPTVKSGTCWICWQEISWQNIFRVKQWPKTVNREICI